MDEALVLASGLDRGRRVAAAALARSALEAYYAALPSDEADAAIADAFLVEGDEVADALVALDDAKQPVGLVAGYPLSELAERQRAALYHLMSQLSREKIADFTANARELAAAVPAIEGEGYYLARIGVAAQARASGLSDRLLARFLADAGDRDAVLHVRGDNARAIAFYRRHGFVVAHDALPYWIMRRPAA